VTSASTHNASQAIASPGYCYRFRRRDEQVGMMGHQNMSMHSAAFTWFFGHADLLMIIP
jgi:hypothetical protein